MPGAGDPKNKKDGDGGKTDGAPRRKGPSVEDLYPKATTFDKPLPISLLSQDAGP